MQQRKQHIRVCLQTLAAKTLAHDSVEHWAAVVTESKSLVIVFLETVRNIDVKPLTSQHLDNSINEKSAQTDENTACWL